MSALWIVFNFVLILLAFYLILHLYQRIRLLQATHTEEIAKEIDAAFDVYLEEVRKENTQFLAEVRQVLQTNRSTSGKRMTRKKSSPAIAGKKPSLSKQAEKPFKTVLSETAKDADSKGSGSPVVTESTNPRGLDWVPPTDQVNDTVEQSPALQALNLQKQGLSTAEIAKRMDRGEGEIQLLLKLRHNK